MATVYVYDKNNFFAGRRENVDLNSYRLADNESVDKPLTIYEYDDNYRLTGLAKIKPGTMIDNATTTVPPDGLNEPTYDPLKNSWYGISDEAYRAMYNVPSNEPNASAELINALTQQVFQLTQKVNQLEKSDQNGWNNQNVGSTIR